MQRPAARQRTRPFHLLDLPSEILLMILQKLDFINKISAGAVCRSLDQLLKDGTAATRHWVVNYNVDTILARPDYQARENGRIPQRLVTPTVSWFINRASAIKSVHVSATLFWDQQGNAARDLLERQLPLLAGCLRNHATELMLTFEGGSPFESPALSSSTFLTLLCPIATKLTLLEMEDPVSTTQFAAICELSNLEQLSISGSDVSLEELTADVSKLVNLQELVVHVDPVVEYIPESISCLQKLERLVVYGYDILALPAGLATLAKLTTLSFTSEYPVRFPGNLQGLESLTNVEVRDCHLEGIPKGFGGLSALTSLELTSHEFDLNWSEGWRWWPTTMKSLTQLANLDLSSCIICSLPPHVSVLGQLTKLDLHCNRLQKLPDEMGSLQKLKELRLDDNQFRRPPISVLSRLTALSTIDLSLQDTGGLWRGPLVFEIPSSLLTILHPGLVLLDLRQKGPISWDPMSLVHLRHAMAVGAEMMPTLTLMFED